MQQGTMVAGWDPSGPGLYYVDSDGQRTKGTVFSVGSGSLYAYGVLDDGYSWCASCSCAARALLRRCVARARASGGWAGAMGRGALHTQHRHSPLTSPSTPPSPATTANKHAAPIHYMI